MGKIFEWDARKGNYTDTESGTDGTVTNGLLQLTGKGYALVCKGATQLKFTNTLELYAISMNLYVPEKIVPGTSFFNTVGSFEDTAGIVAFGSISSGLANETYTVWGTAAANATYIRDEIPMGWNNITMNWNGSNYDIWLNGIQKDVYSGSSGHVELLDSNISLGKRESAANYYTGNILSLTAWGSPLNNSEIRAKYLDLASSFPYKETNRPSYMDLKPTGLSYEDGLVLSYSFIPFKGTLADISGNGNNGSISGPLAVPGGLYFDGIDDYVGFPVLSVTEFTVMLRLKPLDVTSADVFFSWADTGITFNHSAGALRSYHDGQGYTLDAVINNGIPFDIVLAYDGSNYTYYFNGINVDINATTSLSTLGNVIGARSGGSYWRGEVYDIRIYDRALSLTEIQNYHNLFAGQVSITDQFTDEPVDNSSFLGWLVGSGVFKTVETDEGKYIECTTAGEVSMQSEEAYGQWEFDFYKFSGSSTLEIIFISQERTFITGRYTFSVFNDGSVALSVNSSIILRTAASYISTTTLYRAMIWRWADGKFYLFIKGGSFGDIYILVDVTGGVGTNPVTENTFKTSKFSFIDLNAGDRFGAFKKKGVNSPEQSNILSAYFNITM